MAFLQQLTLHGQLRRAGYTIHARRGSRVAIVLLTDNAVPDARLALLLARRAARRA